MQGSTGIIRISAAKKYCGLVLKDNDAAESTGLPDLSMSYLQDNERSASTPQIIAN